MKKRILQIIAATAMLASATSCAYTVPVTASSASMGSKKGVSETNVLFGVIQLNSNYGIKEAAKKAKITGAVATVDLKITNYVLFAKKELIVTGE